MRTDPIADMLTIIRNGCMAGRKSVLVAKTNMIGSVLKIMKDEGYIQDFEEVIRGNRSLFMVTLKYNQNKKPAIEGLKRVSKPGRRIYRSYKEIPYVRNGYGITVLTTSKGIMSDKQARANRIGGELVCEIW